MKAIHELIAEGDVAEILCRGQGYAVAVLQRDGGFGTPERSQLLRALGSPCWYVVLPLWQEPFERFDLLKILTIGSDVSDVLDRIAQSGIERTLPCVLLSAGR